MKKQLLILSLGLLAGATSFAQGLADGSTGLKRATVAPLNMTKHDKNAKSLACGPDTLLYSYLKETVIGTSTFYIDPLVGARRTWSQGFQLSSPLNVTGIQFLGNVQDAVNVGQTITAKAYLYSVDAAYMPLTILDSSTVVVTTAQGLYTAMFTAPHPMSTNFAVAIRNPVTTDTLDVIINNADVSPSYGEALGWRRFGTGAWNTAVAYAGQDLEAVIAPLVTYTINTDYTMSPAATTMCLGTALTFTNTTSPAGIVEHRMYNYNTFKSFWNTTPDSTYAWDMGDASALQWTKNAAYTYPASGLDTVTLFTLGGLWTSCVDYKQTFLSITPNAVASFTVNAASSPMYSFTSTSTNAATYAWDFGDGSPVDNTANPSHTYAPGTYTVTLTVMSAGGCNTDVTTQVIIVIPAGISTSSVQGLNIYPNPSTGAFTLDMGAITKTHVEVYNAIGQLVLSNDFNAQTSTIDLTSLNAGVYSVKVLANNQIAVKQVAVAK